MTMKIMLWQLLEQRDKQMDDLEAHIEELKMSIAAKNVVISLEYINNLKK